MEQLIESIAENGVITPIIARETENGKYEIISGHRRKFDCEHLGLQTVPVILWGLDRNEAAIALMDSNLQREHLLLSEKTFDYKLKMDAMRHQGTSSQVGTKFRTDEIIVQQAGDSRNQGQRYIRLTYLIPELLRVFFKLCVNVQNGDKILIVNQAYKL